jgi:hypothetical protein
VRIYRGDLKPDLTITCTSDGNAVDLTTATSIRIIGVRDGTTLFDRTVTGTDQGVITMQWETTDTTDTGRIHVEAEVTWPGGKPQTFRPQEAIDVVPDYG